MKSQIAWIVLQIIIVWVAWGALRINIRKGEKMINFVPVFLGTISYCIINDIILWCGGFFDIFFK